ncbi:MAG: hypothetical protein NW223_13860 [Hyphomicrobiaceae bacterium]|nr:hypothetical protein [Hyphomicrobiaceae bacterium]
MTRTGAWRVPAAWVAACLLLAVHVPQGARAQAGDNEPVRLVVPARIASNGAEQVALGISVASGARLPPNAFVRIRGLPEAASLSEGYAVAMGSWAISHRALEALKANVPPGMTGQATLTVQLVSMEGVILAETTTLLVLEPRPPPPKAPEPVRSAAPPNPAPRAPEVPERPRLSTDERQRAEKLVVQGERYLDSGNVAIARQFFQRAADIGLAHAALRLAATYDPNELTRIGAHGVVPSPAEARKWYERAKQLGAPEADERIAKLTN